MKDVVGSKHPLMIHRLHPCSRSQVDLFQLQVNTLRRYKRHYKLQTRPGLNKAQLAEVGALWQQSTTDRQIPKITFQFLVPEKSLFSV